MNREDFIKFIPKPENKDVILYDTSLSDLIDEDVEIKYKELYDIFEIKKREYLDLKSKLKIYQESIDNLYLYRKDWNEEDYLQALQNEKKTFSILYSDIKKRKNKIEVLKNKIKSLNEKIEIQKVKDRKDNESDKNELDKRIEKLKTKVSEVKDKLDYSKEQLKDIDNKISENEKEFEFLSQMESELKSGEYKCKYCGSVVKVYNEKSFIYKRLFRNFKNNKSELEKLLKQKSKIETNISYYNKDFSKLKADLNNATQFNSDFFKYYEKKSAEVLKLEALRDEAINYLSEEEKVLKSEPRANTEKYQKIESKIKKYEESLANLAEIKNKREETQKNIAEFKNAKEELEKIIQKLNKYLNFLKIYYKIYEQKANDFCGPDYKFVFFEIDGYKIIETLKIYYKGIEITQLNAKTSKEVREFLIKKFSIYL